MLSNGIIFNGTSPNEIYFKVILLSIVLSMSLSACTFDAYNNTSKPNVCLLAQTPSSIDYNLNSTVIDGTLNYYDKQE